jgi:hypothetical protein
VVAEKNILPFAGATKLPLCTIVEPLPSRLIAEADPELVIVPLTVTLGVLAKLRIATPPSEFTVPVIVRKNAVFPRIALAELVQETSPVMFMVPVEVILKPSEPA